MTRPPVLYQIKAAIAEEERLLARYQADKARAIKDIAGARRALLTLRRRLAAAKAEPTERAS